jgi:AraC-like DNA-binding protein
LCARPKSPWLRYALGLALQADIVLVGGSTAGARGDAMGELWPGLRSEGPSDDGGRLGVRPSGDPVLFTTETTGVRVQFDAYRDWMGSIANLRRVSDGRNDAGFAAVQSIWKFGALRLVHERCDPVEGELTATHLRPSAADHWVIALHKVGDSVVRSDDLVQTKPAGCLSLASLTREARFRYEASETLYLFVPRDLLIVHASRLDRLHNANLVGPAAQLLADHLLALERSLGRIGEPAREQVAAATLNLLEAYLASTASGDAMQKPGLRTALLDAALRHIRRNIAGDLDPAGLCRYLGVSRSHLYRLFEEEGGVAKVIRRERLAAARRALSDPLDSRRIYRLAEDLGFGSAEEFSRAFKRAFGCRPSDVYRCDRTQAIEGNMGAAEGIVAVL